MSLLSLLRGPEQLSGILQFSNRPRHRCRYILNIELNNFTPYTQTCISDSHFCLDTTVLALRVTRYQRRALWICWDAGHFADGCARISISDIWERVGLTDCWYIVILCCAAAVLLLIRFLQHCSNCLTDDLPYMNKVKNAWNITEISRQ